ncbi:hypothetical protein AYO47_02220 [Planctomyces sp. SCGC AG-212-M04]|nr:hypothetical protein AYO47_02220 [Planctomyces sp. SCGC AG-212-M04]
MPRLLGSLVLAIAAFVSIAHQPASIAAPQPRNASVYEKLARDYQTRHTEFANQVGLIADELDSLDQRDAALRLREKAAQPEERSLQVLELPATLVPEPAASLPPDERNRQLRLRALESKYADDLYRFGQRARQNDQLSLAWRFILEAVYRNPDHDQARLVLGYVKYQSTWTTPFRKQMLERGNVWNDQWGWVRKEDLPKYEAGQRRAPDGQWLPADRVASMRADWSNAWEIDSEHFHIRSNHSLERAVEISVHLERFHDYFVREFALVFMTRQQAGNLFAGGRNTVNSKRHIVHYYRTRDEFKARLVKKQPEAAFSDGIYMPDDKIAHFFDRPGEADKVDETMYHEVTHQILTESALKPIGVDNWVDGDFWLVEGLACYLESFQPQGRGGTVGDPKHIRIQWARRFLVDDGVFVPLERFTAMTQSEFQCADMGNGPDRVKRLQQHYAQAAGVTHFFMHFEDGRYRDALVKYLSQIYSADQRIRLNNETLAELTGVPFPELDRQYQVYLRGL